MKKLTLLRTIAVAATTAVSLFSYASIASAAAIITNWQDPVPYSFVSFAAPVNINGSYTLPPDWVGTIYVIQDGVQLTGKTEGGIFLPQKLTIDNLGGTSPKSVSFTIPLGTQSALPSPHTIQLNFFGGTKCYINSTCPGSPTNNADEYTPSRTYTASGSPDPVLVLSYDAAGTMPLSSPYALNFANTVLNTQADRIIYVRNVGGGTASGVAIVSSGENPFYCVPSCAYALPAGAPAVPITIRYLPNIVNMTDNAMLNFSCTPLCSGVNAGITGNSISNAIPPQLNYDRSYINFGMQNIGKPPQDVVLTISNTGGSILTGNLIIPGSDFTCVGNPTCAFSVVGGGPQQLIVRFNPATAGTKDVTATIRSNSTIDIGFGLIGWGNDLPIQKISCLGCITTNNWDVGQIAIASSVNADVEITNIGVGIVTGYLDPTPGTWTSHGWSCTSVTEPDGTVVTPLPNQPCTYYGVTNGGPPAVAHMSYTALAPAGYVNDMVDFKNTANPGDKGTLTMTSNVVLGQLNINVGYIFNMGDALVNNAFHNLNTTASQAINFNNGGASPMVVTLTLPTGAGVFTCDIAGTLCLLDTTNTFTLAGNETKVITLFFNPTAPTLFGQNFDVCLQPSNCVTYTVSARGQDPRFDIIPIIIGSQNEDLWTICAAEGLTCSFSGTKEVYYGNNLGTKSKKNVVGSIICNDTNFGGAPTPGLRKWCWYANPDNGTWINSQWKTTMLYKIDNIGTGGVAEYQFISSPHFLCDSFLSSCSGYNTNPDGYAGGNYDVDFDSIFFNPTVGLGTTVTESVTITYNYTARRGITPTDCPGGVAKYCHTMTLTHTGTGLSGPKITTIIGTFPTTNVGATTVTTLTVINNGTDPVTNVTVGDGSNPQFHCTTNCGPYTLPPGGRFDATISYTASVAGTETGALNITSVELPVIAVPVSGIGNTLPLISITPNSPGFLDYGTVNEGSQAISGNGVIAPIKVKNTGIAALSGDATITAGGTYFKCISCHYGPLNQGVEVEIKIAFAPSDLGSLSGIVSFSGGGGATLQLVGVGALGAASFSVTDANFGRVLIKSGNYKEQVVTVINNGSLTVPSGTISFASGAGGMFTCVAPTPMNGSGQCTHPDILPNGGSVSFTIRFTPTSPGQKTDKIKFSGSANAQVTVLGIGVVPSVKFKEK